MNNLNSVLIEGNLVKDPLFRATPKGVSVCTFRIASNRYYRQDSGPGAGTGPGKEVSFFDVEAWAKLGENCYNLGRKGRGARVVGRLKESRWTGQDGKYHSKISIVAEHVEFRPEFRKEDTAGHDRAEDLALEGMAAEGMEDHFPNEIPAEFVAEYPPAEEYGGEMPAST